MSDWTKNGKIWTHKTGEWEIERVSDVEVTLSRRPLYERYAGHPKRIGHYKFVGSFKSALEASQHVRNVIAKESKDADNH